MKNKILIVTGGHDFEREPFFQIFDDLPETEYIEVEHPEVNRIYDSEKIDQFDIIIFYDMVQEIEEDQKESFITMLKKGKGIIFLHHSLVSYQDWDEFEKIIGGRYYLSSKKNDSLGLAPSTYLHDVKIPVKIINHEHPVTDGLDDFIIHDEVYGGFNVLPTVQPLLSTDHPESGKVIAWTNNYGKSRIIYIQLGHDHNSYRDPNYRRLMIQAINWVKNF